MKTTAPPGTARQALWPWLSGALAGALLTVWVDDWRIDVAWLGALAGLWWAARGRLDGEQARDSGAGGFTTWGGFAVLVSIACGIMFARKPDAWLNPQLWAEDGVIFVRAAWLQGPGAILEPYAGYLHLLPRVVAAIAHEMPVAFVPHTFLGGSLLPLAAVAGFLSSARLPLAGHERVALAALVALPPMPGEVLLNLTNAQWILGFVFVLLLLVEDRDGYSPLWVDVTWLAVAGLTGPFSLVFAPLYLVRAFLRPRMSTLVRAATVVLAAAVQGMVLIRSARMAAGQPAPPDVFVGVLGARVARYLHLGIVSEEVAFLIAIVLMGAALLFVGWLALAGQWRAAMCGLAAVVLFVSYVVALRSETHRIAFGDDRYFSLPLALFAWACVLARDSLKLIAGAVAAGLVCLSAPGFSVAPLPDLQWRTRSACLALHEECHIPINPEGWSIDLPPR